MSPSAERLGCLALGALGALEAELGDHLGVPGAAGGLIAGDDVDVDGQSTRSLRIDSTSTQRSSRSQIDARPTAAIAGTSASRTRRRCSAEWRLPSSTMKPSSIVLTGRSLKSRTAATSSLGLHGQADRLDALGEQAFDLRGQGGAGVVAALGEVGVAGAAAGDRGEQVLVVAAADADGRADGPRPLGAGGELLEPPVVGDPRVGVAVGEQDQGRAPSVGDPLDLLDPAEIAAGEVGHAARTDLRERRAGGAASPTGPAATGTPT